MKLLVRPHAIFVVFDRYPDADKSIKSYERQRRTGFTLHSNFKLSMETTLPKREAILKKLFQQKRNNKTHLQL